MKRLWQRLIERRRRIKAELDQIELELALEEASDTNLIKERVLRSPTAHYYSLNDWSVSCRLSSGPKREFTSNFRTPPRVWTIATTRD